MRFVATGGFSASPGFTLVPAGTRDLPAFREGVLGAGAPAGSKLVEWFRAER